MRTLRRSGAVVLAAAVVTAVSAGFSSRPAHAAATPETFNATGAARALHIGILGQDATFGSVDGVVGAPLNAVANAAGQLLQPSTITKVSLSSDNSKASDPTSGQQKCAVPKLPDPLGTIVDASLACSLAKADITNGLPSAIGQGGVASIKVDTQSLLKSLPVDLTQTLQQVTQTAGTTVDQVQDALQPVIDQINKATGQAGITIEPTTKLSDLLNAVLETPEALSVDLGQATSKLATVTTSTGSSTEAVGGTIKLLQLPAPISRPLATITVGSAKANAAYDRAKGASTATFDPALVTIRLANVLGLTLPNNPLCKTDAGDIVCTIAPGQTINILEGTPLESTITVADGHSEAVGNSAKAVADGVSVQLFKGLSGVVPTGTSGLRTAAATPPGAVVLELAHAEAAVVGTPAKADTPANPAAPKPAEVKALAFTGPNDWMPFAGALMIGAAYGTHRLRRRINKKA